MKKPAGAGRGLGILEVVIEIFFEREIVFHDVAGDFWVVDVAEVPGLVGVAGNLVAAFEITEDEAVFREIGVDDSEIFAVGNHFLVIADVPPVFHEKNVDSEAGVVFAAADRGKVLFAIGKPFLGVG